MPNAASFIDEKSDNVINSSEELNRISSKSGIDHILILNPNEKTEKNKSNPFSYSDVKKQYENELDSVITGQINYFIASGLKDKNDNQHFVVVCKRKNGDGFILLSIESDRLLNFRKQIGLGKLLQKLADGGNIKFIAIQDYDGIISAGGAVKELSPIEEDNFILEVLDKRIISWRKTAFNEENILETVKPFKVGEEILGGSTSIIKNSENEITAVVAVIRDLTEQRKAEENQRRNEKLKAMGELAAGVAHEIKNPLNSIGITVQRFGREFIPEKDKDEFIELVNTMKSEVRRVSEIINQFLKFARPPEKKRQKISMNEFISGLYKSFESLAISGNIDFNYKCNEFEADIDPLLLKQAVANLLQNAFDAVQPGGKVYLESYPDKNNLTIKVSDNGKGIREEEMNKIFNLYFTTKQTGTGLGLSLVNQIVAEHYGTIKVESEIKRGTTFTIEFQ